MFEEIIASPVFPPEIVAEVIGQLRDDKDALLLLSKVSKQMLYESRRHLFTTLQLKHKNERLDGFLDLVDARWTSFTPVLQHIHLLDLFYTRKFHYSTERNYSQIIRNLSNVRSVWISTLTPWEIIPPHILDLLFRLNIEDLRMSRMGGWNRESLINLFCRLPPSINALTFCDLGFDRVPDLSGCLPLFNGPLRFASLDSLSLILFKDVWDPLFAFGPDIRVKAFDLQPFHQRSYERNQYASFTSRFLQHIGPSLESLSIHLGGPYPSAGQDMEYFNFIDLSECITLRTISIEDIDLNGNKRQEPLSATVTWKLLSALPSPRILQEACFTFNLCISSLAERLESLKSFEWPDFVRALRRRFPSLKRITIQVATPASEDTCPYLDVLRRVDDLKVLEEVGIVKFRIYYSPTFIRPVFVLRRRSK